MNDRAFLEQIVAEPDSDEPRLIYADWLDERGCPRGEFIRLQCQRARTAWWHPDYWEMMRREQELLEQHEMQWLGELDDLIYQRQFHRGFPSRFRISAEAFLERSDRIVALTPVEHVVVARGQRHCRAVVDELIRNQVTSVDFEFYSGDLVQAVVNSPLPSQLKHLTIRIQRELASLFFRDCESLRSLKSLEVVCPHVATILESDNLRGLRSLRAFHRVSDRAILGNLAMEDLESLSLPSTSICDLMPLLAPSQVQRLQNLELRATSREDFSQLASADFDSLRSLRLSGRGFSRDGASRSGIAGSGEELSSVCVDALLRSDGLQDLRVLGIVGVDFESGDLNRLFESKFWQQLIAISSWPANFPVKTMFESNRSPNLRFASWSHLDRSQLPCVNKSRSAKLFTSGKSDRHFNGLIPWAGRCSSVWL